LSDRGGGRRGHPCITADGGALTARGGRPSKGFGRFVWRRKPAAPGRRATCSGLWRGLSWRLVMAACHGIVARHGTDAPSTVSDVWPVWCVKQPLAYSCGRVRARPPSSPQSPCRHERHARWGSGRPTTARKQSPLAFGLPFAPGQTDRLAGRLGKRRRASGRPPAAGLARQRYRPRGRARAFKASGRTARRPLWARPRPRPRL